jgi:class 3 adenylate cyclase
MPTLSFRLKLLVSMVFLVAGVAGTSLYLSQMVLQRTYQELLRQQFSSQIDYFLAQQNQRLVELKEKCATLAGSAPLQTALRSRDATVAYQIARDGLVFSRTNGVPGVLGGLRRGAGLGGAGLGNGGPGGGGAGPGGPGQSGRGAGPGGPGQGGRGAGARGNPVLLVRVLDAAGAALPLPERAPLRGLQNAQTQRHESQLAGVGQALKRLSSQRVGYLSGEMDERWAPLLEVVVTPIPEADGEQWLGALVVGLAMFDPEEKTMMEMSHILSGLWLDGQLHTRTIPEGMRGPLAESLAHVGLERSESGQDFVIQLNGEPYRVFHKVLNPESPFPKACQVCVYSVAALQKTQSSLRWLILGISAGILLCGAGISLLLANKLTVSMRELGSATAEVRRGNLEVRVPIRSRDDVGLLAQSFNEMAAGLAQKEKYRRVLNMVADARVAEELLRGELVLSSETREVSVLFCDIRGFTALAERLPPATVIGLLNEHMAALTRIVYEHQGVVDKFMGDLIMAVFGAPLHHGDDALHAAQCALRMIAERRALNRTAAHPIEVGIGLATGEVVAGCMGSTDRVDYTVLGRRVNLASRLCGQAKPGEILIDQATCERLGRPAGVEPLPPLTLKGFSEAVPAFRLVSLQVPVAPGCCRGAHPPSAGVGAELCNRGASGR